MGAVLVRALMNTLMGMGTVFAVLIFISLIISLFKYVPKFEKAMADRKNSKNKKNAPQESRPEPKRPVIKLEEEVEEEEVVEEGLSGDELIAVLTAAIVASTGGAVSADQLRIRSVRRRRAGRRKR